MANWSKQKINLVNIFKKYNTGRIDIQTAGCLTSEKLLKHKPSFVAFKRMAEKFNNVRSEKQYNKLLNTLYNFGDVLKVWIEH